MLLLAAKAVAAPLALSGELSLGADDNLNNARNGAPARGSATALLALNLSKNWALGSRSSLTLQPGLEAQTVAQHSALNSARYQLLTRYRLRPGRGFYTPTFSATAVLGVLHSESALRDAYEQRYGLTALLPLSTRISARLSAEAAHQQARSAVFNIATQAVGVQLDYSLASNWLAFGGWQYRQGDFASTGTPGAAVLAASKAVAADDAYGSPETSFRQEGDSHTLLLGSHYSFSPRWGLEGLVRHTALQSDAGSRYGRWQGQLSLLWRY